MDWKPCTASWSHVANSSMSQGLRTLQCLPAWHSLCTATSLVLQLAPTTEPPSLPFTFFFITGDKNNAKPLPLWSSTSGSLWFIWCQPAESFLYNERLPAHHSSSITKTGVPFLKVFICVCGGGGCGGGGQGMHLLLIHMIPGADWRALKYALQAAAGLVGWRGVQCCYPMAELLCSVQLQPDNYYWFTLRLSIWGQL